MRYPSLDILRGLAALVVAIDHGMFFSSGNSGALAEIAHKGVKILANGPYAVLLFFIISGFCIHTSYDANKFSRPLFLSRRLGRLLIPLFFASLIAYAVGFRWFHSPFGSTIVWSLLCEAVYYVFYASIVTKMTRPRWVVAFILSTIITLTLAYLGREFIEYPKRPILDVIFIGLPVWLMGVLIKEYIAELPAIANAKRFMLWGIVILGSGLTTVLKFKWGVSYGLSLTIMSPVMATAIFYQLKADLTSSDSKSKKLYLFQYFGWSSYSLYLLHQPLIGYFRSLYFIDGQPTFLTDLLVIISILTATFFFYITVERSSHLLCRRLTKLK